MIYTGCDFALFPDTILFIEYSKSVNNSYQYALYTLWAWQTARPESKSGPKYHIFIEITEEITIERRKSKRNVETNRRVCSKMQYMSGYYIGDTTPEEWIWSTGN